MSALANHANSWVEGELVSYVDTNMFNEVVFDGLGLAARDLLGEISFNSTGIPMTVTTDGANNVTAGGSTLGNQSMYLLGRWCPEVTPATFSVPAQTSSARVDLVCAQPTEVLVFAFTRAVRQPDNSIVPTTCYQIQLNATWQYVQGTSPTVPPATPSGFVVVAQLNVPPTGQGPLQTSDIVMKLPTFETVINSYVSPGGVLSLEGQVGNVVFTTPDGCIGVTPVGSNEVAITNLGVQSFNGGKGNVTGVGSITSNDGTLAVSDGDGPTTDLSSAVITNDNATPGAIAAAHVSVGEGSTDGSGNFSIGLPAGYTILSVSATPNDPSNAHAVAFRYVTPLGSNTITLRSCELHDAPPVPVANIPFTYQVYYTTP